MNHFGSVFFGVRDTASFAAAVQRLVAAVAPDWRGGIYTGDNLLAFGRNLSFLSDARFMTALNSHAETPVERSIAWRTAVLVWAARNGLRRDGDFVECGCYRGISARIVHDSVDFGATGRRFWLYDLFDYPPGSTHTRMPGIGEATLPEVQARFAGCPSVNIVKGRVPDVLARVAPERIAFLHLDMNDAGAEVGALDVLFERVVPGGMVVLDDYGYRPYVAQRDAEREWFAARGYDVIELPTSQGLVVK